MKQTKWQPTYLFKRLIVYEARSIFRYFKLTLLDLLAELPREELVTPSITESGHIARSETGEGTAWAAADGKHLHDAAAVPAASLRRLLALVEASDWQQKRVSMVRMARIVVFPM